MSARAFRLAAVIAATLVVPMTAAAAAATAASGVAKTADEVVARNVAARGGLEAWKKIDRMVWLGHIEPAMDQEETRNPKFAIHLERPNRTRFEVKSKASDFTRIFDGSHGWRMHPAKDGRPSVSPFAKSEVDYAKSEYVIDGPLLAAKEKGVQISLDGVETLEGQKAYRLSLVLPNGAERKVWIDQKTNLEMRYDRPSGSGSDPNRPVPTYYRDWSAEDGLMMPHVIETAPVRIPNSGVELPRRDRVVIERVILNPTFDPGTFAMPASPMRRNNKSEIHIDTGAPTIAPRSP